MLKIKNVKALTAEKMVHASLNQRVLVPLNPKNHLTRR